MSISPLCKTCVAFSPPVARTPFLASINGLPLLFVMVTWVSSLGGAEDPSCCLLVVEVTTGSSGSEGFFFFCASTAFCLA